MKWMFIIVATLFILLAAYFIIMYFTMKNVKSPKYTVVKKQVNIEIRQYNPMLIAEVSVDGDREQAAGKGFQMLAGFIFGENHKQNQHSKKIKMTAPVLQQKNEKIAMTAPVIQTGNDKNTWQVKFVMPQQYTKLSLPTPNNEDINIVDVPAKKVVVIRFSGTASKSNLQRHKEVLFEYIKKHQLRTTGAVEYAFYNPPWTLPMMRRNEIWLELE